jgi:Trypsin
MKIRVLFCVVVMAWVASPAFSQTETSEDPTAEYYAATYGVTLDEAKVRLIKLKDAGRINRDLKAKFPNQFGGLYIEHQPVFRVVVKMTGGGQGLLKQITDDPLYGVEKTDRPVRQMVQLQDRLTDTLSAASLRFESSVDTVNSTIEIKVLDLSGARKLLDKELTKYSFVSLVQVAELPQNAAAIYGGRNITGPSSSTCTTGFNGLYAGSGAGVLTSGHCATSTSDTFTIGGVTFRVGQRIYANSTQFGHDMMFLQSSSTQTYPNEIYTTSTTKIAITSVSYSNPLGTPVCAYGVTTNKKKCGTVTGEYVKLTDDKQISGYLQKATTSDGTAFAQKGDSGGPVYSGNAASGLIKGYIGKDLYFVNISDLDAMSVTIRTAP